MESQSLAGQPNQVFEYDRIVNRVGQKTAPGKWAVARHQHGLTRQRVATAECFHNHITGTGLVVRFNFLGSKPARTRNRTVKMVSVRRTQRGQITTRLSPGGG